MGSMFVTVVIIIINLHATADSVQCNLILIRGWHQGLDSAGEGNRCVGIYSC